MPTISIIVPVYNVEKYLSKCIDSILAQTYTDFELLLIDDGSPDRSGAICDEYATRDPRIRVFHKPNEGVSSARNIGLDNARGECVVFVDGDDWVGQNYIHFMLYSNRDADLSMQGYKIIKHNGQDTIHRFDSTYFSYNVLEVFCESEYKNIINSPISKLFKTSILKKYNITFDNSISYGEDHLFVLEYLKHIKSIFISNAFEYNYYQDDTLSLTRRTIPTNLLIAYLILSYRKQMNVISQFNPNDSINAIDAVAWRFYGVFTKLLYDFFITSPSIDRYANIIKTLKPYRMTKSSLSFKRRWLFRIIENMPLKGSYIILKRLFS